ncbi:hypothetical protein DFH28DRAFT_1094317 [Melampsora americana]|nr:hypothetical protein DFH28DRAFT_1094317 [Melampsora americana]
MARTKNVRGAPDELLDQAEQSLVACELEEAQRLCQEVLKSDEFNPRALEVLALIELESGDTKAARKLFNRCIAHCKPTAPPTVYLYLAQLADSPESSLKHFETALSILQEKLEVIQKNKQSGDVPTNPDESSEVVEWSLEEKEVRRSCSRALVGMTELYLTDLCFDPMAEQKCLDHLSMASLLDPTDPEPLQTLASVRLSQTNMDAAKEALLLAWDLWRDKSHMEDSNSTAPDQMEEDEPEETESEEDQDDAIPPYDSRVQWSKLAIECDMWSEAIEVLQQCEAENDEDGEVQYLLAISWHMMGEDREKQTSSEPSGDATSIGYGLDKLECWIEAKEYIDSCVQLRQRFGEDSALDESIIKHLQELDTQLQEAGITSKSFGEDVENPEHVAEDDGDQDWDDVSDVDMKTVN